MTRAYRLSVEADLDRTASIWLDRIDFDATYKRQLLEAGNEPELAALVHALKRWLAERRA